jgi:YVTN family beta-propeller protein
MIDTIPVGFVPTGIAFTPDNARAYVANRNSGPVWAIDTTSNTVIATIPDVSASSGIAITSDGTKAYVSSQFDITVSVIDTATNAAVATIPLAPTRNPVFLALTPDDTRLYVSNAADPITIGTLDVMDTATNTVIATIPAPGFCPLGIAIAPLVPRSKDDCKNGGYQQFRTLAFPNQGQCIKYVNEHTN